MAVVDEFLAHWPVYVSMPLIAAVIGYLTKRAAIEMMFRPMRFVGIKEPWLGWQGVVPRHSELMIRVSADLLTKRLVDPDEIFRRLDSDRLAKEIEGPLLVAVDEITRDVMARYQSGLWDVLPPFARDLIVKQVQAGSPLLWIVPTHEVHVDANFKEVQLERVRIGQPVEVRSDLYGSSVSYHGKVAGPRGRKVVCMPAGERASWSPRSDQDGPVRRRRDRRAGTGQSRDRHGCAPATGRPRREAYRLGVRVDHSRSDRVLIRPITSAWGDR